MSEIKPVSPVDLERPDVAIEKVNSALRSLYRPSKGYIELDWYGTLEVGWDQSLFQQITEIYGAVGWNVTLIPASQHDRLGIRFEKRK